MPQQEVVTNQMKSMIRVNQAGEHGAVQIYKGQGHILNYGPVAEILLHMQEEEAKHRTLFNELCIRYDVRPTLLEPLWHVGGYALGAITALMGEKAAHACTIAVEEVIEEHYQSQLEDLQESNHSELKAIIERCWADEVAHRNHAEDAGGRNALGYRWISTAVKTISRTAIWLSKRI